MRQHLMNSVSVFVDPYISGTLLPVDFRVSGLNDAIDIIEKYALPVVRKSAILSMYILMRLSYVIHSSAVVEGIGERASKLVIDGDYLGTQYYKLVMDCREFELNKKMVNAYKNMVIKRVGGVKENLLLDALKDFLDEEVK